MRLTAIAFLGIAVTYGASFSPGVEVARFPPELDEISGIVASRSQAGLFWVHNDSGDQPRVYAVSREGKLLGTFLLEGATAIDWEDIAIGPAPGGGSYLYLADIGDNAGQRTSIRIYRVAEPHVDASKAPVNETLKGTVAFNFVYEDGPRDAEGFMVDPLTDDFYIVTKREVKNRLYRFHAPDPAKVNTLHQEAEFSFTQSTGAEISPDGMQVLIRRYSTSILSVIAATYWRRSDTSTSLIDLLKQPGEIVPLAQEIQGEAIGFSADNRGFYTTTERAATPSAPLTYYAPVPVPVGQAIPPAIPR